MVSVSSSLPDLLGNSTSSLNTSDTPFKSEQLQEGDKTIDIQTKTSLDLKFKATRSVLLAG